MEALGNQPDLFPGCQHLRNAKPPCQGWVLRAGCSARAGCSQGDSAGPPSWAVQGAAPLEPARQGTAQHPPRCLPPTVGPSASRYVGVQGWGRPRHWVLPRPAQLAQVLVGREDSWCWEPEDTEAPFLAATRGGCQVLWPMPWVGRCWDVSLLPQDQHWPRMGAGAGRWGLSPALSHSPSLP